MLDLVVQFPIIRRGLGDVQVAPADDVKVGGVEIEGVGDLLNFRDGEILQSLCFSAASGVWRGVSVSTFILVVLTP